MSCRLSYLLQAFAAAVSNGAAVAMAWEPTTRWLVTVRRNRDAHIVSASAFVRGLRRRSRLALSGAPRNPLVLVSDLAGAAGRFGREQHIDRCAAASLEACADRGPGA